MRHDLGRLTCLIRPSAGDHSAPAQLREHRKQPGVQTNQGKRPVGLAQFGVYNLVRLGPLGSDLAGSVWHIGAGPFDLAWSCLALRALTSQGAVWPPGIAGSCLALSALTSLGLLWNLHGLLDLWAICSVSTNFWTLWVIGKCLCDLSLSLGDSLLDSTRHAMIPSTTEACMIARAGRASLMTEPANYVLLLSLVLLPVRSCPSARVEGLTRLCLSQWRFFSLCTFTERRYLKVRSSTGK